MLEFVIKLVEPTKEISLTDLSNNKTTNVGIVKEINVRNATFKPYGDKQPLLADQKTDYFITIENLSNESLEVLDKLQKAFPEFVSWKVEDKLIEFKLLVAENTGLDFEYIDK